MRQRKLGTTGIRIPAIGLGTWGYGGFFKEDRSSDDHFVDLLRFAFDMGLTFVDTAEAYGAGHCEELVGRAALGRRDDLFIATKVSPEKLGREDLLRAAEGSLKRLDIDCIDLYQIHWPNPLIPLEETMEAMGRLVEEGKVRFIGVSNFSLPRLKLVRALSRTEVVSCQCEYNLFDRTIEADLLPFCQTEQVTLIAYSPLDQGKASIAEEQRNLLQGIADLRDCSCSQIILNWLASQPSVMPIPRTMNKLHLHQNALALDLELSPEERASIDRVFRHEVSRLPVDAINVDRDGLEKFTPGPDVLAQDILAGDGFKPIRVRECAVEAGRYDLLEGKLRYWAWYLAYAGKKPVPALIR